MANGERDVLTLDLRCDVAAPSPAREALSQIDGIGWALGDAMQVASELVTNALRHSGCRETEYINVRVRRARGGLRISVSDPGGSGKSAKVARPVDLGAGGLGLWLVEQIARSWGTERNDGYRVWAELPVAA
jgi:anti-sigma regulatory factor (Ser/Thr protein kinase)